MQPLEISNLSSRLLTSIDYGTIRDKHNNNFHLLYEKFADLNGIKINIVYINGQMCYPFLINDATARQRLQENRVFVAIYWPGVIERVSVNSLEYQLVEKCLPIPCEQRYDREDLMRISEYF